MLSRLKLLVADFDGCRFGVEARLGLLALKPWRLATSRPELASILRTYRRTKDHEHEQEAGLDYSALQSHPLGLVEGQILEDLVVQRRVS